MLGALMRTSGSLAPWFLGLLASLAVAGGACGGGQSAPGVPVKVLTWNLYLGTDLFPLATVPSPAEIPSVAASMWAEVQASEFPARAKIIAARIAELGPDLVALQEVSLYRRQSPSDFATDSTANATDVELDFLALVMEELAALGAKYRVAVEAPNADVELPVSDGAGGVFDLRVTDRDAILAAESFVTEGAEQQPFLSKLNFTVGGAGGVPLAFTRSASHAGVTANGRSFTIANSHLEIGGLPAVQSAQAKELVGFMDAIPGPVVLLGDFNSAPGTPNYQVLTKSFRDLATALPPPATDPTCCQAGDLMNPTFEGGSRIDLVLTRGNFTMDSLVIVGADPAKDRTPSGKWSSDHLGAFAVLQQH
jgi:endonuclease/exonuclease/phosphatase family metal-dependent hydrolase